MSWAAAFSTPEPRPPLRQGRSDCGPLVKPPLPGLIRSTLYV